MIILLYTQQHLFQPEFLLSLVLVIILNIFIQGSFCHISSGSTLYSCTIEDEVFVGFKSVILEGAKLEKGIINILK